MAWPAELHEPAVVHDPVDDRGRQLVVGEHRAPPRELDVRGEYHAPPLVALGYNLVEQPRPVHVEGHVAELVEDEQPRLGHVGEQPVEGAVALGLAELEHQLGGLPEPHGVARRGRGYAESGGHVGLAPPGLPEEHEVLGRRDEPQGEHVVPAPAVGERHVGPVEALCGLGHREPRLPEQARPLGPVPVRDLGLEHRRAGRDLPGRRGGEEGGDGVAGYEERPRGVAEGRLGGLTLRAGHRHCPRPPPAPSARGRRRPGRPARRTRRARRPPGPLRPTPPPSRGLWSRSRGPP